MERVDPYYEIVKLLVRVRTELNALGHPTDVVAIREAEREYHGLHHGRGHPRRGRIVTAKNDLDTVDVRYHGRWEGLRRGISE